MSPAPRERCYTAPDGLRLFFEDWGDPRARRTPILCLPGLTRNSKDFTDFARRESGRRRVICPDLRGRGRSAYARDWRSYEPRTYLEDLRHLLAALGIGRLVVIGTSMGGLVGMAFAAAMPSVLAGLVLNDVGPDVDPDGGKRILDYISVDRPQPDWPTAVRHLRGRLKTLSLASEEEWLSFARATFREGADGLLHFDFDVNLTRPLLRSGGIEQDLWALWRALARTPVLAIRGEVSDILPAGTFTRMKAEHPDLAQASVPGVGHAPTLNEPPAREALDDFLRRF